MNNKDPFDAIGTLECPTTIYKSDYGPLLPHIQDPPKKLYGAGNTSILSGKDAQGVPYKYVCVIGSRKYTEYGKSICESFIHSLKGLPVIIVSGLALGIDSIAHRAALHNSLPTIALPGSGLHPSVLYPRSHFSLAQDIILQGGLLLSEYDPRTPASPWSFPVRNRLMAALSHAVLIIEAEEDSGTLITANVALDYNREVLAVPGSIFSSTSKGPHALLSKGAQPITSGNDLRKALGFQPMNEYSFSYSSSLAACSPEEKTILSLLSIPLSREELLKKSGLQVSQLQVLLSMLEIRKLIKEEYGKFQLIHPTV